MSSLKVRSPSARVGGLVHFGRMLDKIRVHANGELPVDYQPNLGKAFDDHCVTFLHVGYARLAERVLEGGSDEELLQWCFETGRRPTEKEIWFWNEFMRKRGWSDEVTETLARRKKEAGMTGRSEIETMFEFIDADEGRPLATTNSDAVPGA